MEMDKDVLAAATGGLARGFAYNVTWALEGILPDSTTYSHYGRDQVNKFAANFEPGSPRRKYWEGVATNLGLGVDDRYRDAHPKAPNNPY